jgi:predicted CXXCH cytochrome family protein
MKLLKITFAAVFALAATSVYAFHAGGVAECSGCHSMHSPAPNGSMLLVGNDQSSTCLSCHEHAGDTGPSSYHVSTAPADMPIGVAPLQRGPGGDFGWLKKSYTVVIRGNTTIEAGETHGHNIIAIDKGYVADTRNSTAPGGTYPNAQFHCNSCHDPHGKFRRDTTGAVAQTGLPIYTSGSYNNATTNEPTATAAVGAYRILAGNGFAPVSVPAAGFPGVPPAKVSSSYNRSEAASDTRVAYGVVGAAGNATWGNWCGACHPAMHSSGNYVHPIDQSLGATITANYNAYVASGNMTGNVATAYSSLAPFATDNNATYATLATASGTTIGPGTSDKVMCLSCHRAHASGWENMLRFNLETTFMVSNGIYDISDGKTTAEAQAAYYDRAPTKFATYQRVYCNKCHAKD